MAGLGRSPGPTASRRHRYLEGYAELGTGIDVFYRAWRPLGEVRGVVVAVHGFAEHGARYSHVGEYLASRGYSFWIYDLRGHGMTARRNGVEGYVDDFEEFLEDTDSFISFVMDEEGVDDVYLLGHSMGGLIAVYYAGYLGGRLRGLITSGAAVLIRVPLLRYILLRALAALSPRIRVPLPIDPRSLSRDPSVVRGYAEDRLVVRRPTVRLIMEMLRASRTVWEYTDHVSVPALIMHGSDDRVVPPEASVTLYRRLGSRDKTLKLYRGMRHEVLNEVGRARVLSDLEAWLRKH